jgi:hypothetical protein
MAVGDLSMPIMHPMSTVCELVSQKPIFVIKIVVT